jgi:type I pantothenate kinase
VTDERNIRHFRSFERGAWAALAPLSSSAPNFEPDLDLSALVATGDPVSLDEVTSIYQVLAAYLGLRARTTRAMRRTLDGFFGRRCTPGPFVVGIGGSVAVGKSTTARLLQALLARETEIGEVALVTTDGFLFPNDVLESRGLMARKGFPESYDLRRLIETLAAIRAAEPEVAVPVYSHTTYDIVPGEHQMVSRPDVVIVEGLNVLQVNTQESSQDSVAVSDFFDFSIYVDADETDIAAWFTERLLGLRQTALADLQSYFHHFAALSDAEVAAFAGDIWRTINLVNLVENIAPTRGRAHLIMEKGSDHRVRRVLVRRT